jgi:uncharacterized protein (DUF1697 family)
MPRYVALLRAINTPGRNVKMEPIRSALQSMGLDDVETFIASGNVIFNTDDDDQDLIERIEAALAAGVGLDIAVFLRTEDELKAVASLDPFDGIDDHEVSFLPEIPDAGAIEALVAITGPLDRLAVVGREVYWWTSGPRNESPHSEAMVVKTLGMPTTRRSIRTVRRIADRYLR